MSNSMNMVIGLAVVCCSSLCVMSVTNSGAGGLFGGLLGLPGSVAAGLLGLDKDADGFEGGFTKGVTDPIGAVDDLSNLAQGKPTKGNTIKEWTQSQIQGNFLQVLKKLVVMTVLFRGGLQTVRAKDLQLRIVEHCKFHR